MSAERLVKHCTDSDGPSGEGIMANSADAKALGIEPSIAMLKVVCNYAEYAISQVVVKNAMEQNWEQLLKVDIYNRSPKLWLSGRTPAHTENDTETLKHMKLFFSGTVSMVKSPSSYKTTEAYGLPIYINGGASGNLHSETFAPAWLVKVDDQKSESESDRGTGSVHFRRRLRDWPPRARGRA